MLRRRSLALFVLVGLLLVSPIAVRAQDRENADLERLRFDLKKEGMLRVIEFAAIAAKTPENAQYLRSHKSRITDEFVQEHGSTRNAHKLLEKIYAKEISSGRLKASELKIDPWFASNYKTAFRVTPITADRIPLANGYTPPIREGYLPEVGAIDTRAAHSMTDLRDYLGNRFTLSALDRIVKNGHPVEFHVGDFAETMTSLKNRGYEIVGEVKSVQGNYERVFMAKSPAGEVTYAVTGINGLDRLRHLSSLVRFAGPNGGVAADKVKIIGDIEALKSRNYNTFKTALTHLGDPGGMAWIGFRGGVNSELTRRAMAMEGVGHAQDLFGSKAYEGLIERLVLERDAAPPGESKKAIDRVLESIKGSEVIRKGLSKSPTEVFHKADNVERFLAAEKALGELAAKNTGVKALGELMVEGRMRVRGGANPNTLTASRTLEHRLFRGEELRVRTTGGELKSLKLVNNYYGDVMGDMARAMVDSGYKKIAYFGTAGGLANGTKIGDVHVPSSIYDHSGRLVSEGVTNSMIKHLERAGSGGLEGRIHTNTKLANVFSPTIETLPWLENARRTGMASVEVENSYLAEEIGRYNRGRSGGRPVTFMTAVMISDVPGSEHTLGNNNGSTAGLFELMVDHYLKALGIEGVELLDKEAVEKNGVRAADPYDKLAERLLGENSEALMRENLRSLLKEGLSAEKVNRALRESLSLESMGLDTGSRKAIEAEISRGYSNQDLLKSVDKVNSVLTWAVAELHRAQPSNTFELRLGGGIETGRFSPNSGLTVEFRGDNAARANFEKLLTKYGATVSGAPPIKLGAVGDHGLSLGRGGENLLLREYGALERLHAERLLSERRVNLHKTAGGGRISVTYGQPLESLSAGRLVTTSRGSTILESLKERLSRRGARFERVERGDSRLAGRASKTILSADGQVKVLLAADHLLSHRTMIEEMVRVNQLSTMREALGVGGLQGLLQAVKAGYPDAKARYASWELKARQGMLLKLDPNAPERVAMERAIEGLRLEGDPYARFRNRAGAIDFKRVKEVARTHGAGVASFTLGMFLKELARVIETGDKAVIEQFFHGLASTDFWLNYGLFSIGAEAGSIGYTRFLQRFVKPSFVGGLLKSNVAMAPGMALSEIMMGHFSGKAFAINLSGLMLSSAAVKTGLAGLRWVVSMESLSGARRLANALKLGSVPAWIYAGVETAVVLYFGEKISQGITPIYERHKLKKEVLRTIADVLKTVRDADSVGDKELERVLGDLTSNFSSWRNMELSGAMAASEGLRADLTALGRKTMKKELGFRHTEKLMNGQPGRYGALRASLDKLRKRHDVKMDTELKAATERYYRAYNSAIEDAYKKNKRGTAFEPHSPGDLSRNRGESYDDEAAVIRAAAALAKSIKVRTMLIERAKLIDEIRARDRELLIDSAGAIGGLRRRFGGDE
jgi:hypothetical protein